MSDETETYREIYEEGCSDGYRRGVDSADNLRQSALALVDYLDAYQSTFSSIARNRLIKAVRDAMEAK